MIHPVSRHRRQNRNCPNEPESFPPPDRYQPPEKQKASAPKKIRTVLLATLPLWAGILALLPVLILLLTGPASLSPDSAALTLLTALRTWYGRLCFSAGLGVLLILAAICIGFRRIRKTRPGILPLCLAADAFALLLAACLWLMLLSEGVPQLYRKAADDIAGIQSGQLETMELFLSPKTQKTGLPGPCSDSWPLCGNLYGGIGDATGNQWIRLYVPDAMGFSLDETGLFDETRSIQWNLEHAVRYRITFTAEFLMVTAIEPLPPS